VFQWSDEKGRQERKEGRREGSEGSVRRKKKKRGRVSKEECSMACFGPQVVGQLAHAVQTMP
jgi:hypothetical protein